MAEHLRPSPPTYVRVSFGSKGAEFMEKNLLSKKNLPTARSLRSYWLLCRVVSQCSHKQTLINLKSVSFGSDYITSFATKLTNEENTQVLLLVRSTLGDTCPGDDSSSDLVVQRNSQMRKCLLQPIPFRKLAECASTEST